MSDERNYVGKFMLLIALKEGAGYASAEKINIVLDDEKERERGLEQFAKRMDIDVVGMDGLRVVVPYSNVKYIGAGIVREQNDEEHNLVTNYAISWAEKC